ncbi:MAG: hypothetical protein IT573_08225 [Deltaproteobacteria bacterium]|nr:hypothetical protein [Deltaproteobacteria bacterium]
MDTREIQGKTVEAKGGAFFYEQWKRLRVSADAGPAPAAEAPAGPAERHLRAVPSDPAEAAKKSLDRYKQRLQEYRDCQAARLALLRQSEAADSPAVKAKAQQGLKVLDGRLDFLEKELRHGYRRTKTAVQEIRQAS